MSGTQHGALCCPEKILAFAYSHNVGFQVLVCGVPGYVCVLKLWIEK